MSGTAGGTSSAAGAAGRAQELVERGLAAAREAGAADAVVLVEESSTADLRWAANALTTNGTTRGWSVTVVATADVRDGEAHGRGVASVARSGAGPDDVAELAAEAVATARTAPPAEDAAPLVDAGVAADYGDAGEETGPAVLTGFAEQLGEVLRAARADGVEHFGFAEHSTATLWLGTSAGTRRRHVQPTGSVELNAKAAARSRSTYLAVPTRDFTDVDVAGLDARLRTRLGWQARTASAEPGRWDVVLPPTAVADLLVYLLWSADARSAHEGRSAFTRRDATTGEGRTRVGDRLSPVPLALRSDPAAPGLACAPFVATGATSPFASVFDDGLDVPAVDWVRDGVLRALPTTRHTAALTGLPLAPMADNLLVEAPPSPAGAATEEDLARGLERGLLLTSLWYLREVDPTTLLMTGLTRDGVYLVEGGEVVGAVTNFRFNDSPLDLLRRVDGVGAGGPARSREWGDYFPRVAAPPLLVRDFLMSSVSQAS